MPSWSDLLPEILNKIAGKFDFYEDFNNFLSVCSSWRSSATTSKSFIQHLPSRFPLLMLSESNTEEDDDHEQDYRPFFLLSGGTMRKVQLPEARWQRCLSTNGWLLTTGEEEFSGKLLHPLSRTQIDLPELYMFEELYYDQNEWMYYGQSMRKVVFTSPNPLLPDPDFRVVIIWGNTVGFCRLGDISWSRVTGWKIHDEHLLDITYHKMGKRLYAVTTIGAIYECDILTGGGASPLNSNRLSTFSTPLQSAYLLDWGCDSLLMVTRERQSNEKHGDNHEFRRYGPYSTKRFQCFVFSFKDGKWSELVAGFGDKAVFLGFNSSFAIDAGAGVKPDCIYFTDDIYEPYRGLPVGGGGDVGVYHMSDGRIESFIDSQESIFRGRPPLWLQSSTMRPVTNNI